MVREFMAAETIDKKRSFMVGDRDTDLEFAANLKIQGLRIRLNGDAHETWPSIAARILAASAARPHSSQDQGNRRHGRRRFVA